MLACAVVLCDTATALRETSTEPPLEWVAFVSNATKNSRVSWLSRNHRKWTQPPRDSRTYGWYQHSTQLAACSLGTSPHVRLRSTSENPTGFSGEKWERCLWTVREERARECARRRSCHCGYSGLLESWQLAITMTIRTCILHGSSSVHRTHSWQLLMMIICKYLLSAATIRNGVLTSVGMSDTSQCRAGCVEVVALC